MNNRNTTAHTTWNCKYHIVFAPKFRRKVFYGERRLEIGKILRRLCEWKYWDCWSRSLRWSCTHVAFDSPEILAIINRRIPEGQKQFDDQWEISWTTEKIPKPGVLVSRILCGHDWKEYAKNQVVYWKSIERRRVRRTVRPIRKEITRLRVAG